MSQAAPVVRRQTRFQLHQQQKQEEESQQQESKRAQIVEQQESKKRKRAQSARSRTPDITKVWPYTNDNGIPVSDTAPDCTVLAHPLSVRDSRVLEIARERSRVTWLTGKMFKKYWTRPPRGRKLANADYANKMTRLCECELVLGPHTFEIKTFVVEDPHPLDTEPEELGQQSKDSKEAGNGDNPQVSQNKTSNGGTGPNSTPIRSSVPEATRSGHSGQPNQPSQPNQPNQPNQPGQPTEPSESDQPTHQPVQQAEPSQPSQPSLPSQPTQQTQQTVAPTPPTVAFANLPPRLPGRPGLIYIPYPHYDSSNPATIQKLQFIAQKDPPLNHLMRIVAGGSASPQQIASFKKCIANAEQMPTPAEILARLGYAYYPATLPHAKSQAKSIQKKKLKNIMLVFEFKDNPNDRFVLTKESILEVLPSGQLLISFLSIFDDGPEKSPSATIAEPTADSQNATAKSNKQKPSNKPTEYCPLSVILQSFPPRCLATLERCVNKPDKVRERMIKTLKNGVSMKKKYVWFQIDKDDTPLIEQLMTRPALPEHHRPAARRPYKPRQKKAAADGSGTVSSNTSYRAKEKPHANQNVPIPPPGTQSSSTLPSPSSAIPTPQHASQEKGMESSSASQSIPLDASLSATSVEAKESDNYPERGTVGHSVEKKLH